MAEALLRRRLSERGVDASVASAGLSAEGRGAPEPVVQVMADLDAPVDDHVSRQLSGEMIRSSDLVIGMAREHVRETVLLVPGAFERTFTLKELVRRGGELGGPADGEDVAMWLRRLHEGRTPIGHLGASPDDDVDDPMGRRAAVYERVGDELDALIEQFVELAWGPGPDDAENPAAADRAAGTDELAAT
jgi:protein-tyrosine phosphatase